MIEFKPSYDYELLAKLDVECFPVDVPAEYPSAKWYIGYDNYHPAAFCGWKTLNFGTRLGRVGFLYRAGVLERHRGQGLQAEMIRLREDAIYQFGINTVVTYTDADGAASMRNLINAGYRPYAPDSITRLSGPADRLGRVGFVHWVSPAGAIR